MTIVTLLPDPPSRADPVNFPEKGDNFLGALPTFAVELNAVASEINIFRDDAVNASVTAVAASNTALAGSNFKGNWSSLTGALNKPASVAHSSKIWLLLNNLANVTTSTPGVSADWLEYKSVLGRYSYANRASVRSLTPTVNDQIIIESLGLFCWYNITSEIDDDETCFATSTGRWLLEAAGPEIVYEMVTSNVSALNEDIDDTNARIDAINTRLNAFVLSGSVASSGVTSVATLVQAPFTITVVGAVVGDAVLVIPPNTLNPRVSLFARVTATDTVTVYINNPSASTATITDGVWTARVIKEV